MPRAHNVKLKLWLSRWDSKCRPLKLLNLKWKQLLKPQLKPASHNLKPRRSEEHTSELQSP